MGESFSRSQKELTNDEIIKISGRIRAYRDEDGVGYSDEPGFCAVVGIEQIQENDYALVPSRYVGIINPSKDASEYQESLNSLTQDLKNLMHENHRLERELEDKLGVIGYEI